MSQGGGKIENMLQRSAIEHHVKTAAHVFWKTFVEIVQTGCALIIAVVHGNDLVRPENPKKFIRMMGFARLGLKAALHLFFGDGQVEITHGSAQLFGSVAKTLAPQGQSPVEIHAQIFCPKQEFYRIQIKSHKDILDTVSHPLQYPIIHLFELG